MKYTKKERGITLIALIITIIVMLILVAVTINVALNGGLFSKAKEATQEMEEQVIYEEIVGSMVLKTGSNAGDIDVKNTYISAESKLIAEGKEVSPESSTIEDNATSAVMTVKGKQGTYTYTIKKDEIIIGKKDEEKYIYKVYNSDIITENYDNLKIVVELKNENIINRMGMFFYEDGELITSGNYTPGWQEVGIEMEQLEYQVPGLKFILNEKVELGTKQPVEITFNIGDIDCGGGAYIKTVEGIEKLYFLTENDPWDGFELDLIPNASVEEFLK